MMRKPDLGADFHYDMNPRVNRTNSKTAQGSKGTAEPARRGPTDALSSDAFRELDAAIKQSRA
jgi:hypothetical protein